MVHAGDIANDCRADTENKPCQANRWISPRICAVPAGRRMLAGELGVSVMTLLTWAAMDMDMILLQDKKG